MSHSGTKAWPVVYIGLMPVLAYIALIAILHVSLPRHLADSLVLDPPVLMLVLNTVFLSGVSFVVSIIVARAYLAGGFANILLLGSGILALGGAALAGGWVRPLGGTVNTSVTIHNLGVLLGAVLHGISVLQTLLKSGPEHILVRRRQKLLSGFAGTLILIALIAAATVHGSVPVFWAAGVGSTPLKQGVLGSAIILFALTSVYSMVLYSRNRRRFFYWYSLALALTSIGVIGITVMKAVGDPIGWAGRTAQYLGGVYFLLAALSALREAKAQGLTLEMEIDRFYRKSELHYRDLVETTSDAIISVDEKRRVLLWNHGAERMLGYGSGEAVGCMVDDLLMPEGNKGRVDNAFQEVQERIVSPFAAKAMEMEMRRKDGTPFMSETSLFMRRSESGWTSTLVVRDITERKRAEEALRESEERHRSIFENSMDGIILSFPDGRILAANPEACRMHGYTEAEICRLGRDGIADKSDPRLSKLVEDRSRTGRHRGEVTHVRRDGTKFPCETSSVVFKDKHGREASVLIIRDITERKQAEEASRESERRAKRAAAVNRTMAELGRIIGSTLRIEEVYEQFAAVVKRIISFDRIMIGLINDQQQTWTAAYVSGIMVEGRQVGDVLPLTGFIRDVFQKRSGTLLLLKNEEELAERYPLLLPAFRAGMKSIMAAPLISKDQVIGTIQFSSLTPGAYTEEDLILAGNVAGQITGAIANAQLFAKYERSEEALRRSRDELDLRVQERTAELARKNEELQNFTFAASHDLQEPLRKIQTLSDLLATKYLDAVSEHGRDYLKRMNETATRMRDVLQSLLDYSRLTRTTSPFVRVDLNEIAREVVSDLELKIQDTGALVEIGDLPEIEANAAQMRQLFQNLIGNALKFRREGIQPLVKIYAVCSPSKSEWEICISDNGIGFDEKYLDLIFKPFQQLHGKTEFGGTGMGLAICSKVIEHHNGFITARSVLGEGSTFIVTLPVAGAKVMNKPE